MRGRNLGGIYDRLTPEERFQLVLEAAARKDEPEVERLTGTCPRYRYTSVRNDLAFADRVRTSRQITISVAMTLMVILAKLTVIRTYQECMAILSTSLVNEFDRGFHKGWKVGCEHAWLSAGMAGPFPWRDSSDPGQEAVEVAEALAGDGGNTNDNDDDDGDDDDDDDDDDDELAEGAQALVTEIQTIWEAFTRVCRAEMGAEPETVLLAWVAPMAGWIEGALNAADAVQVDADLLLEYERALTNAWREFLREA